MSEHLAQVMSRSARAVVAPALLLPLACLAALRAVTYLMQGAVAVELLPKFSMQASTGGLGLAIIGAALDLLLWIVVLKLSIEALCDAHEFEGTDQSKIEVVTDFAAVQLGILIVACMLPAYFALLKGHPGVAMLLSAIALVYLPAAVHLTVYGSLEDALSPLAWYGTVRTRRALFMQAPMTLAVVVIAAFAGRLLLAPLLPPIALAIVTRLLAFLAIAMGCVLIGSASQAGESEPATEAIDPELKPEEAEALAMRPRDDATRKVAIDALAYLVRQGAPEVIHDRYRALLLEAGDDDGMLRHSAHYIGVLVQLGHFGKAIALFEEVRSSGAIVPFDAPGELSLLVTKALALNRKASAYALAKHFEARFPRHSWAIEAKILIARLGVELFGQVEEGVRVLSEVVAAEPDRDADGTLAGLIAQWSATEKVGRL
jgi:hypothetical protein